MISFRACQIFLLMLAVAVTPAFAAHSRHTGTAAHHHYSRHHARTRHVRRVHYRRHTRYRGQRGIAPARATQIQDALIHQHYLTGPASGHWDDATEQAMRKYQADHGWQTKLVPDSRALISLGLGPDHNADGTLLNASTLKTAPSAPIPTEETLASIHIIPN